jgi:hypothetical protein
MANWDVAGKAADETGVAAQERERQELLKSVEQALAMLGRVERLLEQVALGMSIDINKVR